MTGPGIATVVQPLTLRRQVHPVHLDRAQHQLRQQTWIACRVIGQRPCFGSSSVTLCQSDGGFHTDLSTASQVASGLSLLVTRNDWQPRATCRLQHPPPPALAYLFSMSVQALAPLSSDSMTGATAISCTACSSFQVTLVVPCFTLAPCSLPEGIDQDAAHDRGVTGRCKGTATRGSEEYDPIVRKH